MFWPLGESMVETPKVEINMGESVTDVPYLQQSVSFGRFERDSLCWERWSTFPTNKYLEEVEKCSTPGSVAQKKAYFEAHYKQIAARRAELLLDQERKREAGSVNEDSAVKSLSFSTSEEESGNEKVGTDNFAGETDQREMSSDGEGSVKDDHLKGNAADILIHEHVVGSFDAGVSVEHALVDCDPADGFNQENDVLDLSRRSSGRDDGAHIAADVEQPNVVSEMYQEVDEFRDGDDTIDGAGEVVKLEVTKSIHELNDGVDVIDEVVKSEVTEHFDKPDDQADIISASNDKQHAEEFARPDLFFTSENTDFVLLKTPALVIRDVPSMQESKDDELPQEKVKRTIVEEQSRNLMKSAALKKTQTAALVKKTKTGTKPASSVPTTRTAPMLSTPKSSKPELTKVTKSASRLFDKKEDGLTPPSIKKTFGPQSGRVYPTSLHMSFSYGPTNPDTASLTMRKSLIMESMGDKDIVKRAFKAFQNPPKRSPPSSAKSTVVNQSASRKAQQKGSPSTTLPKKNEGSDRVAKTASTHTGLQGIRKTSLSPGVNKNAGADQRNMKSVAASFGPRVQLQGSNQKEMRSQVCKKQDARTDVFEATHLHSKPKVEKPALGRKPGQIINSKLKFP